MRPTKETVFGLIILAVLICWVVLYPIAWSMSGSYRTITVNEKERVYQNRDSSKYLVFTDQGVFEVTDSLLWMSFDASDRYAELKPGHTYRIYEKGWRSGILSMYPNILEIEEK